MKNTKFDWTTDCDTAFNQLKHALVHAPVLAMPDFMPILWLRPMLVMWQLVQCWCNMIAASCLHVKSAQLCTMQLPYYRLQTLSNCACMQKMASLSGWQKDCCVDRSQTSYRTPHSTQFEQKISQVVWSSSWYSSPTGLSARSLGGCPQCIVPLTFMYGCSWKTLQA